MRIPFDNNLHKNLKRIYLLVEEYNTDYEDLKTYFFNKNETTNESDFIEEELLNYQSYISLLKGEEEIKPLKGYDRVLYDRYFEQLYHSLSDKYMEAHYLEKYEQYDFSTNYDKVFVKINFRKIVSFLNEKKDLKKNRLLEINPLDFKLKPSEVVYLFRLLAEVEYIENPKLEKGLWKWLEQTVTSKGKTISNPLQLENSYLNNSVGKPQGYKKMLLKLKEIIDKELT